MNTKPEKDVIAKSTEGPVVHERIVADLKRLGVESGMTLLVHSSLSALGWVVGGAQTVVGALIESVGPEGTLVLPTHSGGGTDPSGWSNPPVDRDWWPIIRETMPGFDPDLTPTRGMGAIPECFRRARDVVRSNHPHTSFTARGPLAEKLTADHALESSLGEHSPLARIYDLGGSVLLLGVGHESNTSLHLCEYRAEYPSKILEQQGAATQRHGESQWVIFEDLAYDSEDFEQIGEAYEMDGDCSRNMVGYGDAFLCPQVDLIDFGVKWISKNRK